VQPGIVAYATWVKAVLDSSDLLAFNEPQRKTGKYHYDIRLTALMIAKHGSNGRGCFAAAEYVAPEIGCGRAVVEEHRKILIERGWFTVVSRSGGDRKRAMVLDISFPESAEGKSRSLPHAHAREEEKATGQPAAPKGHAETYNGAVVFGTSGADPWDDDEEDGASDGPPVRMLEGKHRAWG
jgi:hypothetical protein